jgi:hypothetical protein
VVEEVVVVAVVVVVVAVAADAGRAGWVALRPPGPVVTASAPTAGIESRTPSVSPVTRRSAPSAAHR